LTGKSSNLLLLDEQGGIIDVLKRISKSDNERIILPGEKYLFPEKIKFEQKNETTIAAQSNLNATWNIKRQIRKLKKRLLSIEKDHQKQQGFDLDRQKGELLLANLHLIAQGKSPLIPA